MLESGRLHAQRQRRLRQSRSAWHRPSLTALGITNALSNPALELRDGNGALLVANNDWQDNPAQAAELTAAGLAPSSNLESAIAATPPGLYTALLSGVNNGTGIGLVEVYDRGTMP